MSCKKRCARSRGTYLLVGDFGALKVALATCKLGSCLNLYTLEDSHGPLVEENHLPGGQLVELGRFGTSHDLTSSTDSTPKRSEDLRWSDPSPREPDHEEANRWWLPAWLSESCFGVLEPRMSWVFTVKNQVPPKREVLIPTF